MSSVYPNKSLGLSGLLAQPQGLSRPPLAVGGLSSVLGGTNSSSIATSPSLQGLSLLADSVPMWIHVTRRFRALIENLALTSEQVADGQRKFRGVVSCLNAAYYGHNSESQNAFYIGSWSKGTRVRPPRDVDLYFVLPPDVYWRFEKYSDNKQSALLQEVKTKLAGKYKNSDIRGDGPVVLADFESYCVEVVPAFALANADRAYYVCDTKNGGRYKTTRPLHEVDAVNIADERNSGNVRPLIHMLKAWQFWCSVPIKSFYLELLAIDFMDQCAWRHNDYFYYDWISRDFFQWMITKANGYVSAPGTYEALALGDAWKSRAESAYARAIKACDFERENNESGAGEEWQKIFGLNIPKWV